MSESPSDPPAADPPPAGAVGQEPDDSGGAPDPQGADAPDPSRGGAPGARRAGSRLALALAVGTAAVVAGAVWFLVRGADPGDDLGRFQGTWTFAPDGRAKRLPIAVKVTGDRWVYVVGEEEQKRYRLTLRPGTEPKEIDLTQLDANDQPSAFVLRGIYVFEGGTAKVVAAPDPLPRPAAFDAPDGPPVWVLERP